MKIAVGCPIRNRAWILEEWVEHVRIAFDLAGVKPWWAFAIGVGPSGRDDGTRRLVTDLYKKESGIWTEIAEPEIQDRRFWNLERYEQMANYRNRLLSLVQGTHPDYFLSLDSDILLHPATLMCLLETIKADHFVQGVERKFDAVGGKAFLSDSSPNITTYGTLSPNGGGLQRINSDGIFPVQILMAVKLMAPTAYNVNYCSNRFGEDIGWSLNCRDQGLTLGWDGRVTSKHIMDRANLTKVDARVGW